ncbi:hypothetical protein HPB50_029395 [Hyalomma asiaticum]|nr:hypothetical protein HPB50_029395 [Hyalomma asiaticum]
MCAARGDAFAWPEMARPLQEERLDAKPREAQPSTSSSVPEGERDKQQVVEASKDQHEPVKGVDTAPTGRDTPPDVQPPVSVTESGEERMDVSRDEGSSMAGKRSHERTVDSEPQRDDGGGGEPPTKTPASGDSQEKGDGAAVLAASIKAPDAREEDAKRENIVQATTEACAGGPAKEGLDMECEESATPAVGKRQLEVSEENGKPEASAGEPLPKAQFTRRPTLKIQPKVPPDRRATPPAAKTMPADPP